MTVLIEFRPDDHELSLVAEISDPALFGWTALEVPIRFVIDGRDILVPAPAFLTRWIVDEGGGALQQGQLDATDWVTQPLAGFLNSMEVALDESERNGSSLQALALGLSDIAYQRLPDERLVWVTGPSGVEATASYFSLREAIERVRAQARRWITTSRPDLLNRPMWSRWFPA